MSSPPSPGRARVLDTQSVLPGLIVHRAVVEEGELFPLQDALAVIDAPRRNATRRHHTGTHLLHSALRAVLGDHVRQQGSLVAPDRLRFDFSHPKALRPEELSEVTEAANADVLTDASVEVTETSKAEAEALGALAFFDDKYGERVRVVRAGAHSLEFCGGHPCRRLGHDRPHHRRLGRVDRVERPAHRGRDGAERPWPCWARAGAPSTRRPASSRSSPGVWSTPCRRCSTGSDRPRRNCSACTAPASKKTPARLAQLAENGVVVHRQDGVNPDQLRDLAQAVRRHGARRGRGGGVARRVQGGRGRGVG